MNPQLQFMLQQALQSFQAGNFDRASSILYKIIQSDSKCFPALHILGLIKASTGDFKGAAELLTKAVRIQPADASIQFNLAKALADSGLHESSIPHHKRAVELNPMHLDAWINYGVTLSHLSRAEEALTMFERVISLQPNHVQAWSNRGNALHSLKRYEQAIESFEKAIQLDPNFAAVHYNLAITQQELHLLENAISSFRKSIALNHQSASARWNLALCYLLQGNLKDGFIEHEARWDRGEAGNNIEKRIFDKPLWLGAENLEGKTIFIYGEQGLGDFIQFCRYVKLIARRGAQVILEVPEPLLDLMTDLEGVVQITKKGESPPTFDFHCPLLSLPLALKTSLETIPNESPYLKLDQHPEKIHEWKERLSALQSENTKPKIGLVWSGNPNHKNDSNRSMHLETLLQYLPQQFDYIILQKEIRECDRLSLINYPQVLNFSDDLHNFMDTASLIENLDLVISVDTSVAHLSGALGKKTWVLLPYTPDWRWLLDRIDSPWYPTMVLYRQLTPGNWVSVLEKLKADLLEAYRIKE